jgi:hypothetical protein
MVASTREAILIGRTGGGAILPTTTIVVHSVEDLRCIYELSLEREVDSRF